MRAYELVTQVPWAIQAEALAGILEIAYRDNPSIEAVEAKLGRKLDNTQTVTTRAGVATIPIEGPIFRKANLFTQISGATSLEMTAQDFAKALADPAVSAIVLAIDSPGGEVNGVGEFADMIYAARGSKPITAYVSNMGASAAYWIASAADEIVLAESAMVGSIGVIATMRDPSVSGKGSIEFISSQSPNKRPDPNTRAGRTQLQDHVDALADVFVGAVARNRNTTPDAVVSDFGQGGVLVGKLAVAAGMADRLGSYEGVVGTLASQADHPPGPSTGRNRMSTSAADIDTPAVTAELETTDMAHIEPVFMSATVPAGMTAAEAARMTAMEAELAQIKAERDAATAATAEATAKADAAAALMAKMQADAQHAAFVEEVAKGQWAGESTKHVSLLSALASTYGVDSAEIASYRELQNGAAAMLKDSALFAQVGTTGTNPVGDGSAKDRLNAQVKALTATGMKYTDALNKVTAENPDLYVEYQNEQRAKAKD